MGVIIDEYKKIYEDFDYSDVDLNVINKHINNINGFANSTNSCIAIYDDSINKPIYMSDAYINFFNDNTNSDDHDDLDSIHPEDYESVMKSTVTTLKHFNNPDNGNIRDFILIRKYRAKIKNSFYVIIEKVQPIEFDKKGRVWLSLHNLEISPTQSPPYKFEFKIINNLTGEIISTNDNSIKENTNLTLREIEILRLIEKGFLSKDISKKLFISIHTVNTHRQHILEKLNSGTSLEAVKNALNMGIL